MREYNMHYNRYIQPLNFLYTGLWIYNIYIQFFFYFIYRALNAGNKMHDNIYIQLLKKLYTGLRLVKRVPQDESCDYEFQLLLLVQIQF